MTNAMTVFRTKTFSSQVQHGIELLDWPQLLAGLWRGEVRDLPAVQIHQRPAVVLHTAIWLAVALKHGADPADADALRELFESALGPDAGRLTAPPDEVAFYQPAIRNAPRNATWNPTSIARIDAYFGRVLHETKGVARSGGIRAEHAIYALIGGAQRIFVKDNPNSALWGLPVITPVSADGGIGFEVAALAHAYAESAPRDWKAQPGVADHIVWARAWDLAASPLMPDAVGWPFVDAARPTRITVDGADRIGFHQLATTARMLAPNPADAAAEHPGCATEDGVPFRLTKRGYHARVLHAMLFGHPTSKSKNIAPPPILRRLPEATAGLRVGAVAYDQGKTIGVVDHTIAFAAPPKGGGGLAGALARRYRDQAGVVRSVSERYLDRIATTRRYVLGPALATLYRAHAAGRGGRADDATVTARIQGARERFDARVGPESVTEALRLIAEAPDDAEIRAAANRLCARHAWGVFDAARTGESGVSEARALAAAEATEQFKALLRRNLEIDPSEVVMTEEAEGPPALARRVAGVVDGMADELAREPNQDTAKQLRANRTADSLPLAFWYCLDAGGAPPEWLDDRDTVAALHTLAVGMAHISHLGRAAREAEKTLPLGMLLARAGYPEQRVDRLLQARGDTLRQLAVEVRHFLDPFTTRVDWRDPGILLVADARGDARALDHARRRIAQHYVRTARRDAQAQDAA